MNSDSFIKNYFGFFGKLPQFPDFIKYRASNDEFNLLDDWIQKGIISAKLAYSNNWKEVYTKLSSYEFIFPLSNLNKIIAGTLNPGYDKSGRQFPFIVFSIFESNSFNFCRIGILPLILNSFFYKAKQLYFYSLKVSELNDIINEFNKTEIRISSVLAAENIFDEYLSSTTVDELLNRIKFATDNNSFMNSDSTGNFIFNFNSDDENNNFDTGFFLEMLNTKSKNVNIIPCFFKNTDRNHKVKIYFYSSIPEPTEFPKLINTELSKYTPVVFWDQTKRKLTLTELLKLQ